MDKNTLQKFKDALAKSASVGIAVGKNPSLDEMGAALSLYLLLSSANKRVSIACPTDPIVEISSLVGIDRVQRNFGGDAGDLVVSFPYKDGEIEKVSYTLENNFLNIIVKSSQQGLSFNERDVRYSRGSGSIDLLIVVGTARLDDIGSVIDSQKLSNISIVNIDSDPTNQGYGDIVFLSPQASSVCEHVGDIVLLLGFTIDRDAGQNMLSGIISATNDFKDPKTSALALEIASIAMKSGAMRSTAQRFATTPNNVQQAVPLNNFTQQPVVTPQVQQPQTYPSQQPAQKQQPVHPSVSPENTDRVELLEEKVEKPPLDWLSPKVYKGSSEV